MIERMPRQLDDLEVRVVDLEYPGQGGSDIPGLIVGRDDDGQEVERFSGWLWAFH